jgi:hypothetical protein
MERNTEHKKRYKVNSRPILSLLIGLGFFTVVLLVTMISASKDPNFKKSLNLGDASQNSAEEAVVEESSEDDILAVVLEIDLERKQITLYDVKQRETLALSYTGGTNIIDKYGQVIAMSQIDKGIMVEASYQKDKQKLKDMKISTKAWEYVGVSNLNIDRLAGVMKIALNKYKFTDEVIVLDGEEFIPISNLVEQDELTIRGYEETVWSITVTRGHGAVKLEDYDAFLGANITIGYESVQQITENMEITVREGNFNLTVENGAYSATKNIMVVRNQVTYVTLGDLGPEAPKKSRVIFEISPFGADLFVDGELMSYANPIELIYGEHAVEVSLGGYTSYEGKLTIDSAGKTLKIDLPKDASNQEAIAEETETEVSAEAETDIVVPGDTIVGTEEDEIIDTEHLIYIQSPIGASVYMDGEFMCISPGSFKKVIGSHVITFIEEGHETMSYTIEVSDDKLDTYFTFPDLVQIVTE